VQINCAYKQCLADTSRFLVLYGGAGSGKSVFAAQKIIARIVSEPKHKIVATRKVARTLRNSVFALLKNIISQESLKSQFSFNATEMRLTHNPTGNEILCVGLDDPEKIKSIAGITGFWHEEPTELMPGDFNQLNLRLRGKTRHYLQHILTFNPISALHWLKSRFFDNPSPNTSIYKTTYKDNSFIDEAYKAELDALRNQDENLYKIYCLGEWGVLTGAIYKPFEVLDAYPETFDDTVYGLDFGYNNPSALVEVNIRDQEIYPRELIYERGLTTADLINRMNSIGVSKSAIIYADSAEPDRIEEIARAGYNIFPANKSQGSVRSGISQVQAMKIYTLRENENLNEENNSYKWREDRDGRTLDEPEKENDHAMDALRYAIQTHIAGVPQFMIGRL